MRNLVILYLFILTTYFNSNLLAQSSCKEYTLVWSDEFDGNSLDLTKWNYDIGTGCPNLCGWGNGELQYYTNRTENVRVGNGILTIEARPESYNGSSITSGKIHTRNKFSHTYGRFEARMRMPLGAGHWPAFWMLRDDNNWPMTGEIDIMEYRGDQPLRTTGAVHYGSPFPNNQFDHGGHNHTANLSQDFHIYAVEWDDNSISWYFNDVMFKTITRNPYTLNPASTNDPWPWTQNFWIILNNAVGGWFTGVTNPANVQYTKATFEIDYVRVYDMSNRTGRSPFLETPVALPGRIQAENYDLGCEGIAYSDTDPQNQGRQYRSDGVDIEQTEDTEGEYNVGWTEAGEWLAYSVNVQQSGTYSFRFRVASQDGEGSFYLRLNDQNITNTINVGATGGWQDWDDLIVDNVSLPAGNHTLFFHIAEGGFNINYMDVSVISTVSEGAIDQQVLFYPNPFSSELKVNVPNGAVYDVEILNSEGILIKKQSFAGNSIISMEGLSSGIYFYNLIDAVGNRSSGKLIKQ